MKSTLAKYPTHVLLIALKVFLAILCAALVFQLTFSIAPEGWVQSFDEGVLKWVETLRTPFLNAMMVDITALGGLALTVVLGLLSVMLFLLTKDVAAAIHLILVSSGGFMISIWTKGLIARPRPSIIPQLIHASGFSYPSGHSITSSALYLTMAILACRHFSTHSARLILLAASGVMITLISFSRIYLGVHYPSDTMGGALIGITWALVMSSLFTKTHFSEKN